MKPLQRLLREPLLHFFGLGALIFAVFAAMNEPTQSPANTIVIGPARIEQLSKGFQASRQRPPTPDEMRQIIDEEVREEIYYREALALGLDTNDAIVRRRLRQKMEFLADSSAALLEPAPGELEAHLRAHETDFQNDSQLGFVQVYLGQDPVPEMTERLLQNLQSGSVNNFDDVGERSLLPAQLGLSSRSKIDAQFGEGFFGQLAEQPVGRWSGPVNSGFGYHLVLVSESKSARAPQLEEVRDFVLRDWKATKTKELRALHYNQLRERYVVEILETTQTPPTDRP